MCNLQSDRGSQSLELAFIMPFISVIFLLAGVVTSFLSAYSATQGVAQSLTRQVALGETAQAPKGYKIKINPSQPKENEDFYLTLTRDFTVLNAVTIPIDVKVWGVKGIESEK